MSFLKKALKSLKNEYASIVEDGLSTDNTGFIDTGSYVVNALVSGSIFGGYPQNRVTAVAGESSVGKTYFAMTTVKTFLDDDPTGEVVYFDSESAFTKEMFVERGMDTNRIAMVPVATLDEFKFQALKILEQYSEIPKEDRPPLLMVLDSLGNLSSEKELNDASEGKSVQDMTRGRSIRSIFRVLTLKLGKLNVPMLVTNHVYATLDQYNPAAMGGCLVAGTKILVDGGYKNIEDFCVGDEVMTVAGEVSPVTKVYEYEKDFVYRITMEDGSVIECSADHQFLVGGGNEDEWVIADQLEEGMDLRCFY